MTLTLAPRATDAFHRLLELQWLNGAPDWEPGDRRHVLLVFFRASSVACLHAMRSLEELLPGYERQVLVMGVLSPTFPREQERASALNAVERLGLKIPVAHDSDHELTRHYGIRRLPTFLLLNPDDHVSRHEGEADPRKLRRVLERIVARSPADATPRAPVQADAPPPPSATGERSRAGSLRFPSVIKPLPGAQQRWAVADSGHHQVVLLDDAGAEILRFGTGSAGYVDGDIQAACFRQPRGLVCSADAIYVADTGNHAIRRIDLTDRRVTTVAGTGQRGYQLPPLPADALSTPLGSPWDLELDGGDLYFTNPGSRQLGICDRLERTVVKLAGSGRTGHADGPAQLASFVFPAHLALEESGEYLFLTDADGCRVRAVTLERAAEVTTLTPPDGQDAPQFPLGLAWAEGVLLLADCYNNRIVTLADGAAWPGEEWAQLTQQDSPGGLPGLVEPAGVWAEDAERVLVVDSANHRIIHWRSGHGTPWETWPLHPRDPASDPPHG